MSKEYENLDFLAAAYSALTKAGDESLRAAYAFGAVIEALHPFYTYSAMADFLGGKSLSMVSGYARLFRGYPTENSLLAQAHKLGTYDVSRLNGSLPAIPVKYTWICGNCGSQDVHKEKEAAQALEDQRAKAGLS